MIRTLLTVLTLLSIVFFPWQLTVLLVVLASLYLPLLPLAAGILFDALYYAPHSSALGWPLAALFGAALTAAVFIVRSRLDTGSMGE